MVERGTRTPTEIKRDWRTKHPGYDKRKRKRPGRKDYHGKRRDLPFVGCDGEGGGTDEIGRQNYLLFRMGDRQLFNDNKPLSTIECLDFICDAPPNVIHVGFAFDYDVTMILRDLPSERRERLLSKPAFEAGKSRYTFWNGFGIEYLRKQYFRVCRLDGMKAVPRSSRTIYETFGFFQKSFVRALCSFDCGDETVVAIERMKQSRADFSIMTDEIIEYNRNECRYLADMMEKLRGYCQKVGIVPNTWNGAGKLASALHKQHDTMKVEDVNALFDAEVLEQAKKAYYGGRFEVTRVGDINQVVYEYDIHSAYPDAMRKLPCLRHGSFERMTKRQLKNPSDLYVATVSFEHDETPLCGLPIRRKEGNIYWPKRGKGVYWSIEIEAAVKLGCKVKYLDGWKYIKQCDCKSFDWVSNLYEYRRTLGNQGAGYPIKLAINSLYGKLAQRVGRAEYSNPIHAGLITAITRAKIMEAAAQSPSDVVMIATDAIYTLKPFDMDEGHSLGQWECVQHEKIFIVQPGLYWGKPPNEWNETEILKWKHKTRGMSPRFFETRWRDFVEEWQRWGESDRAVVRAEGLDWPSVVVRVNVFTGLKLAQARGKPETAGLWVNVDRRIRFDWSTKRAGYEWRGAHVITMPHEGAVGLESVYYVDAPAAAIAGFWEAARQDIEDQPDLLDLGIPWKERM